MTNYEQFLRGVENCALNIIDEGVEPDDFSFDEQIQHHTDKAVLNEGLEFIVMVSEANEELLDRANAAFGDEDYRMGDFHDHCHTMAEYIFNIAVYDRLLEMWAEMREKSKAENDSKSSKLAARN